MKLYGGIDLHSNNSFIVIINEEDKILFQRRLANDMNCILSKLNHFKEQLVGLVVESTYNWYWLADGLQENGYHVHLENTNAIAQYDGLKYAVTDDHIQQILASQFSLLRTTQKELEQHEKTIINSLKDDATFLLLKTAPGIADILAMTIRLETGNINRFAKVGHYSSYCRCVESKCMSNNKKKSVNNRRNGNPYLCWAFIEAANFAIRHYEPVRRYYQRKFAKTKRIIAIKAVANKLARACYYIQKNHVEFDMTLSFG